MRFKIEYLNADGKTCNWVFPKGLNTLDDAIGWTRRTPSPKAALSVLVRDAERAGVIVWRSDAIDGDVSEGALAPIEA